MFQMNDVKNFSVTSRANNCKLINWPTIIIINSLQFIAHLLDKRKRLSYGIQTKKMKGCVE